MADVGDDDRRLLGAPKLVECPIDGERLADNGYALVRVQQPVIVAVGVRRAVRESRRCGLAGISVCICDRRRSRPGVGRATDKVAHIVDVLLPHAARPCRARLLPVARVGVCDARTVRVLLCRVHSAIRVELPLRLVPGRAAVACREAMRLASCGIKAGQDRIGVSARGDRAAKRIVAGRGLVSERVRPAHFPVQHVVFGRRLRDTPVPEVRDAPHDVPRLIVFKAVNAVRRAGRVRHRHGDVAPERIVGHLACPVDGRLVERDATDRPSGHRGRGFGLRNGSQDAGCRIERRLRDGFAPRCRDGHRSAA